MNEDNLESFLREITLSAVAINADSTDDITDLQEAIDAAVKSRRIVDCVQFEEAWEDHLDDGHTTYHFINFKLSPEVCEAAYEAGEEVNELTWNLVLPNINALADDEKPETSFDWLDLGEVHVNTESDALYATLQSIIVRND